MAGSHSLDLHRDNDRTLHGNSYLSQGCNQTSAYAIDEVDIEPAIIQLAEVTARELGLPWRHSTTHTHQGQGAVERLHQTLFAQVRNRSLNQVRLGGQVLGTCRWYDQLPAQMGREVQFCNLAICEFGEVVLADIKPITGSKL
eukprot:3758728-Amphidinium_carterae.1